MQLKLTEGLHELKEVPTSVAQLAYSHYFWEAFSFFRISFYSIDISSALNFSFSLRFFFWSMSMCVYICVWMLMERRKGSQVYESQACMSYSTWVLGSGNLINPHDRPASSGNCWAISPVPLFVCSNPEAN